MKNLFTTLLFLLMLNVDAQLNLTAPLNDSIEAPTGIDLIWENAASTQYYIVEIDTSINFSSSSYQAIPVTGNYKDTAVGKAVRLYLHPLLYGTKYYWKVKAVDGVNYFYSEIRNFTTLLNPRLNSPADLANGVLKTDPLRFHFSKGSKNYRVQVSTVVIFTSPIYNKTFLTEHMPWDHGTVIGIPNALTNCDFATTYYWRAKEYNIVDSSQWSPVYSFTVIEESKNAFEYNEGKELLIYPNPASSLLYLNIVADGGLCTITNMLGEILFMKDIQSHQETIDVSLFSDGLYHVTITNGHETKTQRILVMKSMH